VGLRPGPLAQAITLRAFGAGKATAKIAFPALMIEKDNEETRSEAAKIIAAGGVIGFRTDTFYGLGADPLNPEAVRKIRALKGREESKPILVLISDESEISRFVSESVEAGESNTAFQKAVELYWPGPLTLVTAARADLPPELTANTETIGLRLPADESVRKLVRACGGALTATSANLAGQAPAFSAEDVQSYFSEGLDMIIDGGQAVSPEPSTVVDVTGPQPRVIRLGVLTEGDLRAILNIQR
jgi:L-threonylcarbamoyladenylate synthase